MALAAFDLHGHIADVTNCTAHDLVAGAAADINGVSARVLECKTLQGHVGSTIECDEWLFEQRDGGFPRPSGAGGQK